ncbi:glycosyltransferase family 39 protein [Flavisphingomonas formosensis]|uniref:glycosyltransferase family 39 protein n=1 Tax=Flavisphingomonas formosensis TaxID=861534 RepID=UPI0012FC5996|nr:glycosyltransferase family 39 protein [Sphingomonas formosensis]
MTAISSETVLRTSPSRPASNAALVQTIARCAALSLVIGLFGRIMTFPLNHDEQIHVVAARLFLRQPLYEALGYNHLPGLPLLLGGFYALSGTDHFLQAGRLLIFLCWLATLLLTWVVALHHTGDRRIGVAAVLLLAAGALLGPAGMLVTNNFLPIPFALLGIHLLIVALEGDGVRPSLIFSAGIAIGFAVILKISYVFLVPPILLAALVAKEGLSVPIRLREILLPLAVGGLIGGLPGFIVLFSDPAGLYAHTVRYFTGGHLAYWQQSTDPKAMSLAAKMLVAEGVWFAGGGLLTTVLVVSVGLILRRTNPAAMRWWPIPFVALIALFAAAGSFAPTPAFPQYYEPPLPFAILLFILMFRQLDESGRRTVRLIAAAAGAAALLIIVPRVLPNIPDAVRPSVWTGNILHNQGKHIRSLLPDAAATGKVATLAPIVVVEGGMPIYREFAAGPFVYRVADYLSQADRRHFTTTSPSDLARFLDADPPAAVITGREPALDPAFVEFARSRGYRQVDTGDPRTSLFVRPLVAASRPASRTAA